MNTIIILAQVLAKASVSDVLRLDIQYNNITDQMSATLTLGDALTMEEENAFKIYEDDTVIKWEDKTNE